MYWVYVLYSKSGKAFYIGQTTDLEHRIWEHNTGFYRDTYTESAKDWELYYKIVCESRKQAIKVERHIKKMKSRKYLESLKNYPEISKRLLSKYQ